MLSIIRYHNYHNYHNYHTILSVIFLQNYFIKQSVIPVRLSIQFSL